MKGDIDPCGESCRCCASFHVAGQCLSYNMRFDCSVLHPLVSRFFLFRITPVLTLVLLGGHESLKSLDTRAGSRFRLAKCVEDGGAEPAK